MNFDIIFDQNDDYDLITITIILTRNQYIKNGYNQEEVDNYITSAWNSALIKKEFWRSLQFMEFSIYQISTFGRIKNINKNYMHNIRSRNEPGIYSNVRLTSDSGSKKHFYLIQKINRP